jgi:hypothetical protein
MLCTHLKRWTVRSWLSTDIFGRAVPWAKLMLTRGGSPDDLNIKRDQKVSVALLGIGLGCALLSWIHPVLLVATSALLASTVLVNLPLFRFFLRVRGFPFAVATVPLHMVYFAYSGASFAAVWVSLRFGTTVRDGNSPQRSRRTRSGWQHATLTVGAGAWWTIAAAVDASETRRDYAQSQPRSS